MKTLLQQLKPRVVLLFLSPVHSLFIFSLDYINMLHLFIYNNDSFAMIGLVGWLERTSSRETERRSSSIYSRSNCPLVSLGEPDRLRLRY